jgi:DNA-binding SARP family transcriptional activator
MAVGLEFGLLGPLVVRRNGLAVPVPGGKPRVALAALLLNADQLATVDQLAGVLWGADPPRSARVSVQNHIKLLRQALGAAARARIATWPGGYVLHLEAGELDVSRFENLLACARAAARDRRWEQASAQASAALLLWRGEPLADVHSELLAQRAVPYLTEMCLQVWETRLEAEVQLGHHADAIVELQRLTAAHPLREHLHALLMLALQRCGRQAEALAAYQTARRILTGQLGAEPGPELRQAHRQVLAGDPGAIAAPAPATPGAGRTVVPRQLPAPVRDFVGRKAELAALTGLLDHAVSSMPAALVISSIGGMAGIGKTALAVHWAHQVVDRFPDGQLYVNLRGFHPSGKPMSSAAAVRGFLDAFQVPVEQIPASPDAQAGLYRSLLAGRRMLVVLDNARDAGQVRPLLPGSPGCLVLVTSRSQLSGLIAIEGTCALALDVLTEAEARELLARRLGTARIDAEPGAAAELIGLCAGLPLALAIAAGRASARPRFRLSALAELAESRRRLDALDAGDAAASVQAVFSWSLDSLTAPAERMFALLGLHPGPDITIPAAASLAGIPPRQAGQVLDELTEAHLIAEHSPGRYAMHDLLRAYAAEQARSHDSDASRHAADHYLYSAHTAALLLNPARDPITVSPPQPGVRPEELADRQQALDWFQAERLVLLAAIGQAASSGFSAHAWQLPWTATTFFHWRGYWQDLAATQQSALAAARDLDDQVGQAQAHRHLGRAQMRLGAYADASAHLAEALDLGRQLGSDTLQARVHLDLAWAFELQGRSRHALGHAQQSLRLHRVAGHRPGEADALNAVGWCHARLGRYQQALEFCGQALAAYREMGDQGGEAGALDSLGYAHRHLGHHAEAIACCQQAIDVHGEAGDLRDRAEFLAHLGDARQAAGDNQSARRAWQQALAILDNLHDPLAGQVRDKLGSSASAPPPTLATSSACT